MIKKVTVEFKAGDKALLTDQYQVVKVTNSVEWTPGDVLVKPAVEAIIRRPNHQVIVRGGL